VRIGGFGRIHPLLDHLHVIDVFDQPPLARVADDQTLDSRQDRDLRLARRLRRRHRNLAVDLDVDEGPQTFVLAEIAARVLVAVSVVRDLPDLIQPDEARLQTVLPEPDRLDGGADRARLAAMFVDDDPRLLLFALEPRLDEIDLRLDGG